MGAGPSVTFQLVEATPYRLRYLLTSQGQPGSTVLPNAAGATPDLRTDSLGGAESGTFGVPLNRLLNVPVANQAEARRLLMGERTIGSPAIITTGLQAHAEVHARTGAAGTGVGGTWLVDADEGANAGDPASAGFAVLVVTPPDGAVAEDVAYLDIHLKRTYDDGPTSGSTSTAAL